MGATTASRADVARLLARAGFGATRSDLDTWAGRPYAELVEHLLAVPPPGPLRTRPDDATRLGRAVEGSTPFEPARPQAMRDARSWWLERMRTTPWPLLERMTLLWHDHFATGPAVPLPNAAMLLAQNDTLRAHALGRFRDMVDAVNVDPAMLHWLDGASSAPPHPNENYARELFELFTLGKSPQVFSEDDIREASRALTGWLVDNGTGAARFDARRHDRGTKRILGVAVGDEGAAEHRRVARIALDHPVATRFVAYKLVRGLAFDPGRADLLRQPPPLVATVAEVLRRTDYDLTAALRALLLSDEFRHGPQRARTPVEQVVHLCKALAVGAGSDAVQGVLDRMGQSLFEPPNVGGWPVDASWLSPAAAVARYQAAVVAWQAVVSGVAVTQVPAAADLAGWAALLGLPGFTPTTERAVRAYLESVSKAGESERSQGVLAIVVSSPDWVVI